MSSRPKRLWLLKFAPNKTGTKPPFRRAFKTAHRLAAKGAWRVGRARDMINCMFEDATPVDIALAPSVEEFTERYVRHERPVIVRGAVKDWPPSYKWTPEYLKAMYGARGVKVGVSKNGVSSTLCREAEDRCRAEKSRSLRPSTVSSRRRAAEQEVSHPPAVTLRHVEVPYTKSRRQFRYVLRKSHRQEHLDGVDRKRDEDTLRHGG